jgi:hypothetical protein
MALLSSAVAVLTLAVPTWQAVQISTQFAPPSHWHFINMRLHRFDQVIASEERPAAAFITAGLRLSKRLPCRCKAAECCRVPQATVSQLCDP